MNQRRSIGYALLFSLVVSGCGAELRRRDPSDATLGDHSNKKTVEPGADSLSPVSVFVGYEGVRAHSLDGGKNWVGEWDAAPSGSDCWSYRDLGYGNGKWIATAWTGGFNRISTSTDGVHWRHAENLFSSNFVSYGNGVFLLQNGYSADGYTFVSRPMSMDVGSHPLVRFDPQSRVWLASGDNGNIARSEDGVTFTTTYTDTAGAGKTTRWAFGLGIILGVTDGQLVRSGDSGNHWDVFTLASTFPTETRLRGVLSNGTYLYVFGDRSTFRSQNAYGWERLSADVFSYDWMFGDLRFGFIAQVGTGNWVNPANFKWSTDGLDWKDAQSIQMSPSADGVLYTTGLATGIPSTDPNGPWPESLPPSVELTKAQLLATTPCTIPPSRN